MKNKYNEIYKFAVEKIFKNAPLKINDQFIKNEAKLLYNLDELNVKYPYKPFLILSIIMAYSENEEKIFNLPIYLNSDVIVKNFYNLITSDYLLYKILGTQKSKNSWTEIGFNQNVKKQVFSIMLSGPIQHLESKWFKYDKNTKHLSFDFGKIENKKESIKYLEYLVIDIIKKIIPWYKNYDKNIIESLQEYEYCNILINGIEKSPNEAKVRDYQYKFRKHILDRDQKCVICCIDNNAVLEACHIKPFADSHDSEKYDINNGITMCSNHHKLFDKGLFTFNESWKVILSKSIIPDESLFFKQYEESCYSKSLSLLPNMNNFVDYHRRYIFSKE